MSKPMITTIIPTYRRPQLLKRAIKSVLNQTYPDFQVCVYDNASGDETAEVVSEFAKADSRVKYFCHSENIGAGENFLYGMKQVNTEFFSFLSDDDILLPEFYERAIKTIHNYPSAMFVATRVIRITDRDNSIIGNPDYFPSGFYKPPEGFNMMIKYTPPIWTGILFQSYVIEKLGFIDLNVGLPGDFEYEYRIASYFPYIFIDYPGAIYTFRGILNEEESIRIAHLQLPEGRLDILNRIQNDYGLSTKIAQQAVKTLKKGYIKMVIKTAFACCIYNDLDNIKKAAQVLKKYYGCNILSFICSLLVSAAKNYWFRKYLIVYMKNLENNRHKKLDNVHERYKRYVDYYTDLSSDIK